MKNETSLTVEQQFKLKVYANQTLSLSAKESRILLVEMMRQNMIQDNEIKNLLNPNPNE
ncbi:NblA/ycf18 family protein [Microcoleus sp. S28C3]|uniref:NblA/ycf18 family protein n=1 Tax=Microcoleus sp. S28C3 TaxID=3055414 RepID=UPI002FD2C322